MGSGLTTEEIMTIFEKGMQKWSEKDFSYHHEDSSWSWWKVYDLKVEIKNSQMSLYYKDIEVLHLTDAKVIFDWEHLAFLQYTAGRKDKENKEKALTELEKKFGMYITKEK